MSFGGDLQVRMWHVLDMSQMELALTTACGNKSNAALDGKSGMWL